MTNPMDVVIAAAVDYAASLGHLARAVEAQATADEALPLTERMNEILFAVEEVRP